MFRLDATTSYDFWSNFNYSVEKGKNGDKFILKKKTSFILMRLKFESIIS